MVFAVCLVETADIELVTLLIVPLAAVLCSARFLVFEFVRCMIGLETPFSSADVVRRCAQNWCT